MTNREYTFRIGDETYAYNAIATSGVPQGSHIGPLLFVFYARDIVDIVDDIKLLMRLFADDTKLLCIIRSMADSVLLQRTIDKLDDWSRVNQLPLNPGKIKCMTYSIRRKRKFETRYYIGDTPIERVKIHMDLGMMFDEKLQFDEHMKYLLDRLNKVVAISVKLVKDIRCNDLLAVLYRTYVLPIAETNSILWQSRNIGLKNQLERIQRRCTRIALRTPFNHTHPNYRPYENRLIVLDLMKLSDRRDLAAICYLIKVYQNPEPTNIKTILNNALYDVTMSARNRKLFSNIGKYTGPQTSLHSLMTTANEYHTLINMDESIISNRSRIRKEMMSRLS